VITERSSTEDAEAERIDQQGHRLTAWQQYACQKFGHDCRIALAIQRAENPLGKCENTVHLQRPALNLRDLLHCKANIDFAYQLYQESHGFAPWCTYNSGKYRQFLKSQ
jgi:hypothetical protein